jgi:secreted PhoX family phosphatase
LTSSWFYRNIIATACLRTWVLFPGGGTTPWGSWLTCEELRLLFESPSADVLNEPDNLTVSPRGGLVLCEDGYGTEYVHGLTSDGVIFRFIQNNVGACYSPDGKSSFVNIQSPGITFAITGAVGGAEGFSGFLVLGPWSLVLGPAVDLWVGSGVAGDRGNLRARCVKNRSRTHRAPEPASQSR